MRAGPFALPNCAQANVCRTPTAPSGRLSVGRPVKPDARWRRQTSPSSTRMRSSTATTRLTPRAACHSTTSASLFYHGSRRPRRARLTSLWLFYTGLAMWLSRRLPCPPDVRPQPPPGGPARPRAYLKPPRSAQLPQRTPHAGRRARRNLGPDSGRPNHPWRPPVLVYRVALGPLRRALRPNEH